MAHKWTQGADGPTCERCNGLKASMATRPCPADDGAPMRLTGREQSEPASINRLGVRSWRRARWLTQAQLAQLLGVQPQTVYRWESGQTDVPPYLKLALDQLDTLHYWSPDGVDALPRLGSLS